MKYLLDTNICIYLIKRSPPVLIERFQNLKPGEVGISSITLAELQFGVQNSQKISQNQTALANFLIPLQVLPFENQAAYHYGVIRSGLKKRGCLIGPMDLMIAAHAMALNKILVTNNPREFERITGLFLENWVKSSEMVLA